MARRIAALLVALSVACADAPEDVPAPAAADVTWHRDVQPLVREHCIRCHVPDGVGNGDFTAYADVAPLASLLVARIEAGEMPPPAADPDCHDYRGSARLVLDDDEAAVFRAWADQGAPEGDPADAVADLYAPDTLEDPDVVMSTKAPYAPTWVDGNEYRCFILDHTLDETTYVTAFEPILDAVSISHHTVLFYDPTGTAGAYVTDPATDSWTCPDVVPDSGWSTLHAWAPGNNLVEFGGAGIRLSAGGQLILQMHYFESGPDTPTDQPGYRLATASSVDTRVLMLPLGPQDFLIPAGDDSYSATETYDLGGYYGDDVTIYGVFPHMHSLGAGYHFWAEGGGEDRCIARADRYDFDNQPTYLFKRPLEVPSRIGVECTWNNTTSNPNMIVDPPVDTAWGEKTQEEMCFAILYVSF